VHQRDAVAALRLVHEVGGDEDGHPVLARQVEHQLPETIARHRVDPRGGLVEDQDLRLVDHRHGQRQALANAQRQALGEHVHDRAEVEAAGHLGDAGIDPRGRHVEQPGVQHQVLPYRQLAIQGKGLGHVANPLARGHVARVDRLAEQQGLAGAGRQQAGEHLHGGALAAAVGAEEAEDLAAADAERHRVDRDEVAEAHGQALGLDGDLAAVCQRRYHHLFVPTPAFFRQQGDKGLLQAGAAGAPQQLGRAAFGQHAAGIQRHQVVEAFGLLHVGGGHQHAHLRTLGADAGDQLPELVARQRVDAGGRFVEDQQVGVVDQRAAQPQFLLHAAGQLARRTLAEGRQAGAAQQVVDAPRALGGALAEQAAEEVEILEYRQRGIEVLAQALRHIGDMRADVTTMARFGHIAAEHLDAAGLDPARPGDQRQQAGLADAVRADQADHALRRQHQVDRVEGTGPAVAQADAAQAGDRRVHCGTLIARCAGHAACGSRRR
jgi:hypothetical protein